MIEGGEHHLILQAVPANNIQRFSLDIFVIIDTGLYLNICLDSRLLRPGAVLLKGGYALEFRRLGMELRRIKLRKLLIGVVLHKACAVRGPVDALIVNNHNLPVPCELHIQLNGIRPGLRRLLKGQHGIFRVFSAVASVGHHFHCTVLLILPLIF